ncbi:unnamed protein product [Pleuronectes platessa]|uniref:Uncharacterized protein n=1 Tax=Pleuronectes platessa TaxID=8262 RepID=A0A9N7U8E8_PLEPL|nr:unnamed protein product [Pleuronectes platessa]
MSPDRLWDAARRFQMEASVFDPRQDLLLVSECTDGFTSMLSPDADKRNHRGRRAENMESSSGSRVHQHSSVPVIQILLLGIPREINWSEHMKPGSASQLRNVFSSGDGWASVETRARLSVILLVHEIMFDLRPKEKEKDDGGGRRRWEEVEEVEEVEDRGIMCEKMEERKAMGECW